MEYGNQEVVVDFSKGVWGNVKVRRVFLQVGIGN